MHGIAFKRSRESLVELLVVEFELGAATLLQIDCN